jgi:hypothetical protein
MESTTNVMNVTNVTDVITITICKNSNIHIYIDENNKILYIEIINGEYNEDTFIEAIKYVQNFWILISNTDDKYYQMFICNDIKVYPLSFYTTFIETLKSLESIFKTNLHSSCLINNSGTMDMIQTLLNMYKSVRPFSFVKTIEEGILFMKNNHL